LLDGESPLKVWREKRGRSQRELAAAAGVSPAHLAEIETGRKPGSVLALARLARALEVQIEDLIMARNG
jgi:transcriptional regulator with XRE-family HTH domain